MASLEKFREMDMVEQIGVLEDIKGLDQVELLPELIKIYSAEECDDAVDEMLYFTIFELLDHRAEEILAGIDNGNRRIRQLCIRKAADVTPKEVKKRLVKELDEGEDQEMVSEIIRALSYYKDPGLAPVFKRYLDHEDPTVVSWAEDGLDFIRESLK
ncbi:MAG: HEAT repeat domain-containing protein [Proteobacteria bacterium]|nr:HEAT repeat domain-containing protein [Pseudomonadota bacterium]